MLTGDMLRRAAYRFPDKPAIRWEDTVRAIGEDAILRRGLAVDSSAGQISWPAR